MSGKTYSPPSSFSFLRTISTRPSHMHSSTARCSTRCAFFLGLTGSSCAIPCKKPLQLSRTGHSRHFGLRGVHIVAPISIIALANAPGRSRGTSSCARAAMARRTAGVPTVSVTAS